MLRAIHGSVCELSVRITGSADAGASPFEKGEGEDEGVHGKVGASSRQPLTFVLSPFARGEARQAIQNRAATTCLQSSVRAR